MLKKKLTSVFTCLAISLASITLAPVSANASVPIECATTITKGGVPASESEVVITTSGIYCVASFKTVADDYLFTVPAGITKVDYLVVGGGGGGASGGGGAGGFLESRNYSVTPGAGISVQVGRGGNGGNGGRGPDLLATKGGNSVFGSVIAYGGGAGGAETPSSERYQDGGSGGGSTFDCIDIHCSEGTAGVGTTDQGNNGGYSTYNSYGAGGGGGGAGGAGFNTTRNFIGGNGGDGLPSDITGTSVYYAGGGGGGINSNDNSWVGLDNNDSLIYSSSIQYTNGGGQGGLGGGGRGSSFGYAGGCPLGGEGDCANATAGAANTGGGGGGTDPEDTNGGAGGSGIVIVRWVSNANLKTVTFNSNVTNPTTTIQKVGSGVATNLNANSFSRTGWVFSGWTTNADGTGTQYSDGQSLTTSSDVTLYAKWLPGVTHTVTFNANSGSGSMANQVSGVSTNLNQNTFTKSGYTFAGWNTAANGSGFSYTDGASYNFSSDVTMYAQWSQIVATYRVSFYGNGAQSGSTAAQVASSTTALNLNGFTRAGYNFLGWNTAYDATTALYLDGENYSFTADANLYAIWVAQSSNTITYDSNGTLGAPASGSMPNQVASRSTLISANEFTRPGYTFTGWNTAADGTGVAYLSNYVYSFASSRTLYAQWGKNITISYNANTADSGQVAGSQSTYVGSPGVNLDNNSRKLVKSGYRLAGWNTREDGTGTPHALGASSVRFNDNTVLYALWTPAVYQVIYSGNGNTAGSEPAPQTFTIGSAVVVRENVGGLAKEGHIFSGWNTAVDGTGTSIAAAPVSVSLSSDTVLFAQWTRIASVGSPSSNSPVQAPTVSTPVKKVRTLTVSGFAPGSKKITAPMKSKILKFIRANKDATEALIVGFTEGKKILKQDYALSLARARVVADLIKSSTFQAPNIKMVSGKQLSKKSANLRRVVITLK